MRRIIPISSGLRRSLSEIGIGERQIAMNHMGIDLRRFRPATVGERVAKRAELGIGEADFCGVYVGGINARKGVLELVRAWHSAVSGSTSSRLRLLLVGPEREPDYSRQVREEIAAAGLRDSVRFLGARDDVPEIVSAADVYVTSAFAEGLPVACLEALAVGTPVVCRYLAGVSEDLHCPGAVYPLRGEEFEGGLPGALRTLQSETNKAARSAAARAMIETKFEIGGSMQRLAEILRAVGEEV